MKKVQWVSSGAMAVVITGVLLCSAAMAGEKATKEECEAKCKTAAALIQKHGFERAKAQLMDLKGPFVWKDSYVFVIDLDNATNLAHAVTPGLIGKPLAGIKDVNGKMFYVEFINVAKTQGEGWVGYMWPKPGEQTPSPKNTYIYRVPGLNIATAAGIYENF